VADRLSALAANVADQIDGDEHGFIECVQTARELCDIGVKGSVALAEAAIAGPCSGTQSGEPLASDDIPVDPRPYPQNVTIVGPFVRVGEPAETIPESQLECRPSVIPPYSTVFQIALRNYHFIGANYAGSVRLSPAVQGPNPDVIVTVYPAL
jgi:hypothetical protein